MNWVWHCIVLYGHTHLLTLAGHVLDFFSIPSDLGQAGRSTEGNNVLRSLSSSMAARRAQARPCPRGSLARSDHKSCSVGSEWCVHTSTLHYTTAIG